MSPASSAAAEMPSRWEAREVEIPRIRQFYWSVRRELWENRFIYLAPLAAAAVFLAGFFVTLAALPGRIRGALALAADQQRQAIEQPYVLAALMVMAIALIVAVVYCLDASYGERRDRSILFWKSLPVSDLTAVLAKASIPILVIPLIGCAVTVATQAVMLLTSSAVLAGSGISAVPLWEHVPLFGTSAINFRHLVMYHGLWYAPFYGWLLMVSAWAARAPFLWATLPPIAVGVAERITFNSSHFAELVRDRFMGDASAGASPGGMTMEMLGSEPVLHYLMSPGLWGGLAVTATFLYAAVRLRRLRVPI